MLPDAVHFHPYNLLAGLIFSGVGWGALRFGRSLERWKPVAIGLALMLYPYFCLGNPWLLWGIGTGLLVLLGLHHDE